MITRRQFVTAAIGLAAASSPDLPVARAASWRRGADAPTRRSEVAAAVLGEAIYVVGGFGGAGGLVEAYHPLANRWERRASLPLGLHHTAAVAVHDRLFVVGGYRDGWTASDVVFAYDPGADRWQARRPMPTARGALAAAGDAGKISVIGGRLNGSYARNLGVVEEYDPAVDAWRARAPLSTPRSGIGAAALGGRIYSHTGRPSIPPEQLLRALLLQVLYTVRSERQLMEQLDYNLLFRWFVGLHMDDPIWDVTVFTKNRDRLLAGDVAQACFDAVLAQAKARHLVSSEHFTVDGTLLEAWANQKSFKWRIATASRCGPRPRRRSGRPNPRRPSTSPRRFPGSTR